jgi:hypothetical protein
MHSQFTEQIMLDAGTMRTTPDGYLVANPRVARTGIQLYTGAEMGVPEKATIRVYRPEDEVFSADAMRTFAHRPITNDHPQEMVNAANWHRHAIGHSGGEIARDGDCIRVPLVLMDERAITDMRAGKAQLSVGYTADIKWGEGRTPGGEAYDAVQTDIRANHIALVHAARGGSRLRLGDNMKPMHDGLGAPTGLRPGYVFGDVTDEDIRRVEASRQAWIDRVSNAWKDAASSKDPAVTGDSEGDLAASYERRRQRLQNAWRGAR